jgi:hypothetical protein
MQQIKIRRTLILVHLYLASVFAPMFVVVAITGGNYLLNIEGETSSVPIALPANARLDFESPNFADDVRAILSQTDANIEFEYMRSRGNSAFTRPTTRPFVQFEQTANGLTASLETPNLQYKMLELHKGHGPTLFRNYQIFAAISLFFVVFGGLIVGVIAKPYRRPTLLSLAGGSALFILLAFYS